MRILRVDDREHRDFGILFDYRIIFLLCIFVLKNRQLEICRVYEAKGITE